jgi:GntR family transcriptional regulator
MALNQTDDALLFGSGRPQYLALAENLSRSIREGKYPIGGLLPAESELCQMFSTSRHTVREAIRKLCDLGMVTRHQGIGTRVESNEFSSRYLLSLGTVPDILRFVHATKIKIIQQKLISREDAPIELPFIGGDNKWLMLRVLRRLKDQTMPVSYHHVFFNGAFREIANYFDDSGVPFFTHFERHFGKKVERVRQQICAVVLDAQQAKILKAQTGEPALHITRHYESSDGVVLQVGQSVSPASRFTYTLDISREYTTGPR